MSTSITDAERALLSLCRDRSNFLSCQFFNPEAFTSPMSVSSWKALTAFHDTGDSEVATSSHLRLLGLSNDEIAWSTADIENEDARVISIHLQSHHARTKLTAWATELQDRKITVEDFIAKQDTVKDALSPTVDKVYEFADSWVDEERDNFLKTGYFSTGFRLLDSQITWVPGNYYVLSADTGCGKSFLADAFMNGYCQANKKKAGLITLEMNRAQRAIRWHKAYTKQELSSIYMPKRTNWDLQSICREIEDGCKAGILFWVVDHFHLIPNNMGMTQTDFENYAARMLERVFSVNGAIGIVVAQMSKDGAKSGKDAGYSKHSVKGSKGVIDAAAGVMLIKRENDMDSLFIDKNRFATTGTSIGIDFNWASLRPRICTLEEAVKAKTMHEMGTL